MIREAGISPIRRAALAAGAVAAVLAIAPVGVRAAAPPVFEPGVLSSSFPASVSWRFTFESATKPLRIELLTRLEGTELVFVSQPATSDVTQRADGSWVVAGSDVSRVTPNTAYHARLRVTTADGVFLGPEASVLVADQRFVWQVRESDRLRLHWYEGDDAFARRALRIGEDGVTHAEDFLGVRLGGKVDIFVYADQAPFRDAIGPGSPENAAGVPFSSIQTFFALIRPEQIDSSWVDDVVPHELVHLVLDAAIGPGIDVPLWLHEGLAVYLSSGNTDADRRTVRDAVRDRTLVPLDGLAGDFPSDAGGARSTAAYAEAVSAVDFMVRTYGQAAIARLVAAFATQGADAAFMSALGTDMTGFQVAWLASLDAATPQAYGPAAAARGPLPVDWQGPPPVAGLLPSESAMPTATAVLAAPASRPGGDPFITLALAAFVTLLTVVSIAAYLGARRRGRGGA
jgi:hypothetical protein